MMRLHDYLPSGNGYKVRLLLAQLGIPFERIEYDVGRGETRTPEFLEEINANGRVPVLELDDGSRLPESNAILFYLADGTTFLPGDRLERARVHVFGVQMMEERRVALETKRELGYAALGVMEGHLEKREFFVAECYTIADVALYAYTHVADKGASISGASPPFAPGSNASRRNPATFP